MSMIDNFATPGEPITLPADFKGQPTATRQIAAVEKVSVTVLAPYFYYKTQDFGFCSGASSTEKWIRDNSEQIFHQNSTEGEKIETLPQIWIRGTMRDGQAGSPNPASTIEYRS